MNEKNVRKNKNWRIIDIINWGESYFESKEFESPKQEIEWLLCDLLQYKRIDLYIYFEKIISKADLKRLKEWVGQRINREPLQYITGSADFYGRTFRVSPDVLIPRPETEKLIEVALESLVSINSPKILEVGSGSGCISITLGAELPRAKITALDISSSAIKKSEENATSNNVSNITFLVSDFLTELPVGDFDILISNPPYISKNELSTLMPDVRNFEPEIALTDNKDGLEFYRRISNVAKKLVNKGYLLLEVGIGNHPEEVMQIFKSEGYSNLKLIKDYNGDQRVLKAKI